MLKNKKKVSSPPETKDQKLNTDSVPDQTRLDKFSQLSKAYKYLDKSIPHTPEFNYHFGKFVDEVNRLV